MHFICGHADGNALKARPLHTEQFPVRTVSGRKFFKNTHRCLRENSGKEVEGQEYQ